MMFFQTDIKQEIAEETDQKGVVMVETALSVGLLLMLVVGGIDFLRLSYLKLAGDYVTKRVSHWAAIGSIEAGKSRVETIESEFIRSANQFGFSPSPEDIHICPGVKANCKQEDAGFAGDYFVVTYDRRIRLLSLPVNFPFRFRVYAKNERF